MCRFKSFVMLNSGRILDSDYTDSHDQLLQIYEVLDILPPEQARFVRLEYVPECVCDIDSYRLHIDSPVMPIWWNEDLENKATSWAREYIRKHILLSCPKYIEGGPWILGEDAHPSYIIRGRIISAMNLKDTDAHCCNMDYANLVNANLENINLGFSSLYGVNLKGANLSHANLGYCELDRADLTRANLSYAYLKNSSIVNTIFHDALFKGTLVTNKKLRDIAGVKCDLES